MGLLDDIKARADASGDGKVSRDDLESMRNDENSGMIDKLQGAADQNDDGKLSMDDVKDFDLGDSLSDTKDKLFGP